MKADLREAVYLQDLALRMKSRSMWVKEGDANKKLFHSMLNARKAKNFVSKIELDNGDTVCWEENIVEEIVCFYEKHFSKEERTFRGFRGVNWDPI